MNSLSESSGGRNKSRAVLVRASHPDADGDHVLELAIAIKRIKGFTRLSCLSRSKFRKAMEDDSSCDELKNALRDLCYRVGRVGLISVDEDDD